MNKTVNVNLGGLPFILDEPAYAKLENYLATLKAHFAATEGNDEIMSDIEARIAELFKMRLRNRQIVVVADVEEAITIIGKPEDLGATEAQPNSTTPPPTDERKRLYRDEDDAILGGVCSGLGNYFDVDPVFIRVIWAIAFFTFGFGFLVYIILWVVIPKAKTPQEKLNMRGEKYDLNSIKENFTKGANTFSSKVNNFTDELKSPQTKQRFKNLGNEVSPALRVIGKLFLGFVGFILAVIGIALAVALFTNKGTINLTDELNYSGSFRQFASFVIGNNADINIVYWAIAFVVLVPILLLLHAIFKSIFNLKYSSKWINILGSVLFWAGVTLGIWQGAKIALNFSEEAEVTDLYKLPDYKFDTLVVKCQPVPGTTNEVNVYMKEIDYLVNNDNNTLAPKIKIGFEQSAGNDWYVRTERIACGTDAATAEDYAEQLSLGYLLTDSLLTINRFATLPANSKWRVQQAKLVVGMPLNATLILDKSAKTNMAKSVTTAKMKPKKMAGNTFVMTAEGLDCKTCGSSNTDKNTENEY